MNREEAKKRSQMLKHLREEHKDTVERTQALLKEQKGKWRQICQSTRDAAKTVPEIAELTGLPAHEVLWHVAAMKKYDQISETGTCGEYYLYQRVEAKKEMSNRVDSNFLLELKEYGAVGAESCFNCGTCTAQCPMASDGHTYPRNMIRLSQLGLKDQILENVDPWLCYYCGDCSETCPREAEPGETMMALRRWLTAEYDWTGLARKFYTSIVWEIGSVLLVAALIMLGFAIFHGPIVTDHVELNTFAPAHIIEILDWIMFVVLASLLLSNVLHMVYLIRRGSKVKAPLSMYFREVWELVYQFATQARWSQCEGGEKSFWQKISWRNHWILMAGYVTMLILIVVFLRWFQTDNIYPIWHPQRWVGYLATVALIFGAGDAIWGRIKRNSQMHRFSHPSDWMFPILILLTALTGILVHIFRYMGMPLATYGIYVIHLAALVPMLVLEVPFGKWSHLAYRPVAIYLLRVNEKAEQKESEAEVVIA